MANGQAFTVVNAPQLKLRAYRRPDESGFKPCASSGEKALKSRFASRREFLILARWAINQGILLRMFQCLNFNIRI